MLGHDNTRWTEVSQHPSPISPTMHVDPAPRSLCPLYRARDRRCRQHAETFPVPIAAVQWPRYSRSPTRDRVVSCALLSLSPKVRRRVTTSRKSATWIRSKRPCFSSVLSFTIFNGLPSQAHIGRASSTSSIACKWPDTEDEHIQSLWPCGILRVKAKVCHECESRFLHESPCTYPGWCSWLLVIFDFEDTETLDDLGTFSHPPCCPPFLAGSLLWALWRPLVPLSISYPSSHGRAFGGSLFISQADTVPCYYFTT